MLSYLLNIFDNSNFFYINLNKDFIYTKITFFSKIDNINIHAHLMLQFVLLVFLLSLIALAVPNYFGLYGAFLLTLLPLFFA